MTTETVILRNLQIFIEDLKNILDAKGLTDTGKAKESLKIIESSNLFQVVGIEYLEFLNRGSEPWANQSPGMVRYLGHILTVSGWAQRHGVNAYAAANSIVKKGSRISRNKSLGIEIEKQIELLKQRLAAEMPAAIKFEITQKLNKFSSRY